MRDNNYAELITTLTKLINIVIKIDIPSLVLSRAGSAGKFSARINFSNTLCHLYLPNIIWLKIYVK